MPGLCGYIGNTPIDRQELADSIDLLSNCHSHASNIDSGLLVVSWLTSSLFSTSHVFEDAEWTAYFSGDLVDFSCVPWDVVLPAVRQGKFEPLNQLIGVFSFAVLDKLRRKLTLITDQIGQAPLFFKRMNAAFVFSTSISTFCRLKQPPLINREWLYEFMYFNYAVGSTTVLKDVFRISAASVIELNVDTLSCTAVQYGGPARFSDRSKRWTRKSRIQRAVEVLASRIPKYYTDQDRQAVSLTAGLDSQTVLCFAPRHQDSQVETYTYGVPGCFDLESASLIAKERSGVHHEIAFDKDFFDGLDQAMYQTLFLSGGLERVNRSTLLHVYQKLTQNGERFPIAITGISGDHLFRDHMLGVGNVPSLISEDMMATIHTGSVCVNEDVFGRAFGADYAAFRDYIHTVIDSFHDRYGRRWTPLSYLRFLIFEVGPRYFVGETVVGGHYTAVRSPYWDSHLHKLAFELDYSTLGFSKFLPKGKDQYRECVLQASIIAKGGTHPFRKAKGLPIWAYTSDNKVLYSAVKAVFGGRRRFRQFLTRSVYAPLEDWPGWFAGPLREKFLRLLGANSRISEYIQRGFIEEVLNRGDMALIPRLVTAEIVLRLVENQWKMPRHEGS